MSSYLDQLKVSPEVRAKIEQLAATSAQSLLGMFYASMEAFVRFLGTEEAARVVAQLEAVVGPAEVARLKSTGPAGSLGAMIDPP